mmetsp:Transcript_89501/g.253615  ORF Transcript_89501/g.253615 Transcript_89501/m.253615 type:complete len:259 (+) Transcript_89501:461-1237(+)
MDAELLRLRTLQERPRCLAVPRPPGVLQPDRGRGAADSDEDQPQHLRADRRPAGPLRHAVRRPLPQRRHQRGRQEVPALPRARRGHRPAARGPAGATLDRPEQHAAGHRHSVLQRSLAGVHPVPSRLLLQTRRTCENCIQHGNLPVRSLFQHVRARPGHPLCIYSAEDGLRRAERADTRHAERARRPVRLPGVLEHRRLVRDPRRRHRDDHVGHLLPGRVRRLPRGLGPAAHGCARWQRHVAPGVPHAGGARGDRAPR